MISQKKFRHFTFVNILRASLFALLIAPPASPLAAQDAPILITGTLTSGYFLDYTKGTSYEITAGSFLTDTGGATAINDGRGTGVIPTVGWHIRNAGSIGHPSVGTNPSYGIYLTTTGSSIIINEASGLIRGNRNATHYGAIMNYQGGFMTLINAGEIRGYTTFETSDASGLLSNSGRMVGSNFNVLLYASSAEQARGNQGTVINSGHIEVLDSGNYAAVRIDYKDGVIRNFGGVLENKGGGGAAIGAHTDGRNYGMSGFIENSGGGLITTQMRAVYMASGGTLWNSSGIIVSALASGVEINRQSNSAHPTVIYNGPNSLIQGSGTDVAYIAGVRIAVANSLDLDNHGSIIGYGKGVMVQSSAAPIFIQNHAGAIISNTAALPVNATISNNSGAILYNATVSATINNAGLIEGTPFGIYAGGGLTLTNTGTITGSGTAIYLAATSSSRTSLLTLAAGSSLGGTSSARSKVISVSTSTVLNRIVLTGSWRGSAEPIYTDFLGASGTAGFASLTMNGTGEVRFMGEASLTGNNASALAINSGAFVLRNTIYFYNANGGVTIAPGATLTFSTNAAGNNINSLAGPADVAPKITNNGSLIFSRSDVIDYNGIITGTGSLTKQGAGTVTLSGANSYGDTNISAGTLVGNLGKGTLNFTGNGTYRTLSGVDVSVSAINGSTGAIDLAGGANLVFDIASGASGTYNFSGNITGGGGFVKNGAGTLTLAKNVPLADALIKNGIVKLDGETRLGANITLGGDTTRGLLEYTGASAWTKNLALARQGGGFLIGGSAAYNGTTTGTGAFVKAGAGTLDITGATMDNTGNTVVDGGTLRANVATIKGDSVVAAGATLEFNQTSAGSYAGAISGGGSLLKTGDAALTLTGTNTYGDTRIVAGLVEGNAGRGTLTLDASGTYKMGANSSVTFTGILGNGAVDLNNNNLVFNVAPGVTGTYEFQGALTNGADLVKTGEGTLDLTAAITLANAAIEEGMLRIGDQSRLNASNITLGSGDTRGLIDYTGASAWTKNLALGGAGGGVSIGSGNVALNATVSGASDFVKAGAGTLDITGATMNNTGNTIIDGGTLRGNTATINGNTTVAAGATVEFNQAAAGSYGGNISGPGSLLKTGAGSLTLGGVNNYGDTRVAAGLLQGNVGKGTLTVDASGTYKMGASSGVTLGGILGNGAVDLNNNNLAFDVAAGVTGTFSFQGTLTNGRDFIKTGAGTLDLASAVTLANAEVKDGTLRIADQSKLNTGSLTLGDATTHGLLGYTGTAAWTKNITLAGAGGGFSIATGTAAFTATVNGAGSFVKSGSGALDITGATMNHAGNTRVEEGLLRGNVATIKGDSWLGAGAVLEFSQAADATYAGAISGEGALLKTGAGALTLSSTANSYGGTIIEQGAVIGMIGTGVLDIKSSGTYKVGDGQRAFTLTGITGNGTLDLNRADLLFDVNSGTSAFSFSGSYSGAGGNRLIKTGAGTLDLLSRAALPGGASIEEGIVRIANQDYLNAVVSLGSALTEGFLEYTGTTSWTKEISVSGAGGGFVTANADAVFSGGVVSGDGVFIKEGQRMLDVTNARIVNSGGIVIRSGTLRGNVYAFNQRVEVKPGAVMAFHQTQDETYTGLITGGGGFLKTGAGVLTLARPVEYTGDTLVTEGVLRAGAKNLWLGTSHVTTAGAGAVDMGGFDQRIANLSNNGAIIFNATVNSTAGVIYGNDSLIVTGTASGSGKIRVHLNEATFTGEPWVEKATLLEIPGEDATAYTAELSERQIAGAYDWTVTKDGNFYILAADQLSPEIPAVGGIDITAYLSGQAALSSLNKRLMTSRDHAQNSAHRFELWANGLWREDNVNRNLYKDASARTRGFQVGGDWNNKTSGGDRFFTVGIFYDNSETDLELPGKTSSTEATSDGWGLYASYQPGPCYLNALVRVSDENYEIFIPGTRSFKTDGRSIAGSLEFGALLPTGWAWNIEPQAEAVVQKHKVDNPVDSMGRVYDIECADTLSARLGVRVWRDIPLWGGKFMPYARASVVFDWGGQGSVGVAGLTFDDDLGGSTGALDAGAAFVFGRHVMLTVDGGWYAGARLNGYGFNTALVFRW